MPSQFPYQPERIRYKGKTPNDCDIDEVTVTDQLTLSECEGIQPWLTNANYEWILAEEDTWIVYQ